ASSPARSEARGRGAVLRGGRLRVAKATRVTSAASAGGGSAEDLLAVGARRGARPALERPDEGARLRVADHVGDVADGEAGLAEVALGGAPALVVHERRQRRSRLGEAALEGARARGKLAGHHLELEVAVVEALADDAAHLGEWIVLLGVLFEERP